MEEKVTALLEEIQKTNDTLNSRVQECFSVGYWFIRISKAGINDAFTEFEKSARNYIERKQK